MSTPLNALAPNEVEFIAENELISIVPNFSLDSLRFISATYGPFRPQRPIRVPLWLAVTLKKRQKCKIQAPDLLDVDKLRDLLRIEQQPDTDSFARVPFHYLEIAFLLLDCASDDIRNANQVRTLLEDLRERRQVKVRLLMKQLSQARTAGPMKMTNMSMMEANELRPLLLRALGELTILSRPVVEDGSYGGNGFDGSGGGGDEQAQGLAVRPTRAQE